MSINSFSQAVNAYQSAVRNTENLAKSNEQASGVINDTRQAEAQNTSFADLVGGALQSSRDTTYNAEAVSTQALLGKADISDVITAVSGAEMTLNTVVSVRDRMINAYQDIIKMPI